jgi:hypothetical protein
LLDILPRETMEIILNLLDQDTERNLFSTCTKWRSKAKNNDYKLYYTKLEDINDIVRHFSALDSNFGLEFINSVGINNIHEIVVISALTNLTKLIFDGYIGGTNQKSWIHLRSLSNLEILHLDNVLCSENLKFFPKLKKIELKEKYSIQEILQRLKRIENAKLFCYNDKQANQLVSHLRSPELLTALEVIDMRKKVTDKFIVDKITNFSNLQQLKWNFLADFPFEKLSKLECISIASSSVQAPIRLGSNSSLTFLQIYQPPYHFVENLSALYNLKVLEMEELRLNTAIYWNDCSTLTALEKARVPVEMLEHIPSTRLTVLSVYNNDYKFIKYFPSLPNIQNLTMAWEGLNQEIASQMTSLKSLSTVHSHAWYTSFANLKDLEIRYYSPDFKNITTNIQKLTLKTSGQTVPITEVIITQLQHLKQLKLEFPLRENEWHYIAKMTNIERLELFADNIQGKSVLMLLTAMHNLTYLDIGNFNLSGDKLTWLTSLKKLKYKP